MSYSPVPLINGLIAHTQEYLISLDIKIAKKEFLKAAEYFKTRASVVAALTDIFNALNFDNSASPLTVDILASIVDIPLMSASPDVAAKSKSSMAELLGKNTTKLDPLLNSNNAIFFDFAAILNLLLLNA